MNYFEGSKKKKIKIKGYDNKNNPVNEKFNCIVVILNPFDYIIFHNPW